MLLILCVLQRENIQRQGMCNLSQVSKETCSSGAGIVTFVDSYHYSSIYLFQPMNWAWGVPQTHPCDTWRCLMGGRCWLWGQGKGGEWEDSQFHVSVHDFLSGVRCMCVRGILAFLALSSSLLHSKKMDSWKTRAKLCYTTVSSQMTFFLQQNFFLELVHVWAWA